MNEVAIIPLANLLLGFLPVMLLVVVMKLWGLNALQPIYANFRMLVQLLLIGYVLTYIFETDKPIIILLVVLFMILMSSWIALRPLQERGIKAFLVVVASLGLSGMAVLFLISQFIVELPRWFEPSFIIPIAGMLTGIIIPLAAFLWLYRENKNKYAAVVEISKNLDNPSKAEELIKIFEDRKKEPIDYRRSGVITLFVGIGIYFLGVIAMGRFFEAAGVLVALIGVGQIIAGYLYPNTGKELTDAVEEYEKK